MTDRQRGPKQPQKPYSGIAELLTPLTVPSEGSFFRSDVITWTRWAGVTEMALWQAVALHSFFDPEGIAVTDEAALRVLGRLKAKLYSEPIRDEAVEAFLEELVRCEGYVAGGNITYPICTQVRDPVELTQVNVAAFVTWLHWSQRAIPMATSTLRPGPPSTSHSFGGRREAWPWGSHTTHVLYHLATVANAFWRRQDEGGPSAPSDPSTASKRDVVAARLEELGVSKPTADSLASALRPADLKPGPRIRRQK